MVKYALGYFGHDVTDESHAILPDGSRYFGLLSLRSNHGQYEDAIGLRNSHDKSLPIGLAFGSRVFICDNLALAADHVIRRKHTANSKRDLPGLIAEIVEPLKLQRQQQQLTLERYADTMLSDVVADHAMMEMYRRQVIGVQRIADVHRQYHEPDFDWGDKTAYRLFNATTYALTGKVAEKPVLTQQLHNVLDLVCEHVN
jgi:hypothetical protein